MLVEKTHDVSSEDALIQISQRSALFRPNVSDSEMRHADKSVICTTRILPWTRAVHGLMESKGIPDLSVL